MYRKIMKFLALVAISLSLMLGLFSVIRWEVVAVLIAVFIGIPSLILTQVSVKPKEEGREQEQEIKAEEKEVLQEETISLRPDDGSYYDFELKRGEHLKGEISSDVPIDIYFVNTTNFRKWKKNKSFYYEDCTESVLETKIDYVVPRKGTWYLLIENNGKKSAIVRIRLY